MAIKELEGDGSKNLEAYTDESSDKYQAMVDKIGERMGLTSLKYQRLDAMVKAIGFPREKLCTYCWNGCDQPCG
jgi:amidophosphoribosyltransferase